jgi:hypothetical protein
VAGVTRPPGTEDVCPPRQPRRPEYPGLLGRIRTVGRHRTPDPPPSTDLSRNRMRPHQANGTA